ncbi:MAG: hypothetical protein KBS82_07605 [Oscillospiraceae bacterium]|nr:hypothetical protein [Candidatus Limimonas egerieequi]
MALDKLVDSTALDNGLTTVADAIRTKGGTTAQLSFPNGMAQAIEDLPSGGEPTLPAEYQEVEYITASGTQYIDTEFVPKIGDKFEYRYSRIANTSNQALCQSQGATYALAVIDADKHYIKYFTISATGTTRIAGNTSAAEILFPNGNFRRMSLVDDVNGQVAMEKGETGIALTLLARNNHTEPWYGRLFYFNVKRNGSYVFYGIPCYRKSDEVVGLYDAANNVFYTNDGTGAFTAGPNVN